LIVWNTVENFAKLLLDAIIIGLLVRRGNALTNRAYAHLRNPAKNVWFATLFAAADFTDEGQAAREDAVRFWRWGIPVACVGLLLIGLV